MQYTSNYNLMLPEGTDTVNLLTQMNPNTSDIDAAMYANKQATVGRATELTAGTVHAITRSNPDSPVFAFTATSNWTAGDTMTVDGTACTVYLSDGTTPASGAYIINTEVLAIMSGTRVTLLLSSGFDPSLLSGKADKTDLSTIEETGVSASQAIAKGKIFWLSGDLCKALADIAAGATFNLGVNYEVVFDGGLNAVGSGSTVTSISGVDENDLATAVNALTIEQFANSTVTLNNQYTLMPYNYNDKAYSTITITSNTSVAYNYPTYSPSGHYSQFTKSTSGALTSAPITVTAWTLTYIG